MGIRAFIILSAVFISACGNQFKSANSQDSSVNSSTAAPRFSEVSCPATTRLFFSQPNNVGATQSCTASFQSTNFSSLPVNASSVTNSGSYSLVCQATGEWAAIPSASLCPPPAPGAVSCAGITRTITSVANSAGATQTCNVTLPSSSPSATAISGTVTNGGSYTLICQASGQWATTATTSLCPAPSTVTCAATTRTITSAANSAGATQNCVASFAVSNPSTTPVSGMVTNAGSYTLICQSSGQWATAASSSFCPAPGAPTCMATTRSMTSPANNVGSTQTCVATLSQSSPGTIPVVANPVTNGGSYSLVCLSSGQWESNPSAANCPAPAPQQITPAVTWTSVNDPALVYNQNVTLSFSVTPSTGVTLKCLTKPYNSSAAPAEFACTGNSAVVTTEGDNLISVMAVHTSGGSSTSTNARVRLDKTRPTGQVTVAKSADGTTFQFTLTASESIAYVIYKIDGTVISDNLPQLTYSRTQSDFNQHTAEFILSDYAGNLTASPISVSFKRAPVLPTEAAQNILTSGRLLQRVNGDNSGVYGNGSTLTWDGKLIIATEDTWTIGTLRPQAIGIGTGLNHDVNVDAGRSERKVFLKQQTKLNSNEGFGATEYRNYVTMLYRILLNREPDVDGLNFYTGALNRGEVTPESVKAGFIASPEYAGLVAQNPKHTQHPNILPSTVITELNALTIAPYYTDRALLLDLYQNLLGREPDQGGWDYWSEQLKAGVSRQSVINGFINSSEANQNKLPHGYKNFSRLATAENPYTSDIRGEYSKTGAFRTYDLLLYTQVYNMHTVFQFTPTFPFGKSLFTVNLPDYQFGVMRVRVVVSNPDTLTSAISGYYLMSDFKPLTYNSGGAPQPVKGIEPTVTADGLLMVFQDFPTRGYLMYTYNEDPDNPANWSQPHNLTNMHLEAGKKVQGVNFEERYALAKTPIKTATGQMYAPADGITGAYPWINWEGSEVFFQALHSAHVDPAVDARRGGTSVVGQWTGNSVRLLDGFFNRGLRAYQSLMLFTFGIGSTSSIWNPFNEFSDPKLPYLYERPSMLMLGFNDGSYADVSFKEFVDGRYLIAWPMNEAVDKMSRANADGELYFGPDFTQTPDLSGNFNTGQLAGGAFFLSATGMRTANDNHQGYKGQAVFFPQSGYVYRNPNSTFQKLSSFTVEAFIKPIADIQMRIAEFGDTQNSSISLVYNSQGQISGRINNGAVVTINSGAEKAQINQWTHVALTYDSLGGVLKLYLNGKMVSQVQTSGGAVYQSANYGVYAGPGASMVTAAGNVVVIDEFRLSFVARASTEIADAAHLPYSERFNFDFALPPRFSRQMLRISDEQMISKEKAQLGAILFIDKRLSANNTVSCASCHSVSGNLSDPLVFSKGLNGNDLTRHSPVAFNRAFSSTQMWDGKFSSLHSQAIGPISNPNEMGLSAAGVVAKLSSNAGYQEAFTKLYGENVNANNIQQALSAFMSVMMTKNDSKVDRFELGNLSALNEQEIRGRKLFYGQARCVACHSGSNYTDEQLHNTGFFAGATDNGKKGITGRASDNHKFKTPTLRNIAETAPYMHDGRFSNLEAVIALYNLGSLGDAERSQEIKPLNLNAAQVADLAAFLRALSSPVTPILPINLTPTLTIEQYLQ